MVKKDIINNYEEISLENIVTYYLKDIILISDGSMVVSMNGKLATLWDRIRYISLRACQL